MKRIALLKLRQSFGMTQKEVSELVNINRSYYGHIENGVRNPSLDIATSISKLFKVSIEEAFPNDIFFANKSYIKKQ
ncbi:MAG: helix-turn-helix transcriptional regulator [Peptostreptococcaceae bacterium]|jgi:putative transcriptional regulator|nr:helix-turn-helix transcriptional regulator [Peptostreptococcaceae bacterium]